ncbi:hypothetical protein D1872_275930 [compost metagenome]
MLGDIVRHPPVHAAPRLSLVGTIYRFCRARPRTGDGWHYRSIELEWRAAAYAGIERRVGILLGGSTGAKGFPKTFAPAAFLGICSTALDSLQAGDRASA